jgi:NDP-sugar pyrophosphorylase family protein
MVPIGGKPLLERTVEWLLSYGFSDIAVNLNYLPDVIVDYFGNGDRFGVRITYSHEQKLLGTAGAIKQLASFVGQQACLVVYGDVFANANLHELSTFHESRKSCQSPTVTLAAYEVTNPEECGILDVAADGRVYRIIEKPSADSIFSRTANAGIMIVAPSVLDHIPANTFYDVAFHLLPDLLLKGVPVYARRIQDAEYVVDIGNPERYRLAEIVWQQRHHRSPAIEMELRSRPR